MVLFYIIWIVTGGTIGALINTALKGGKFELLARAAVCAAGAVAAGWVLQSFGFEPGGAYPGAVVNAAIGGVMTLPVLWYISNA